MLTSDVELFLANWPTTDWRVFDYKDYGWFDIEVLVIHRVSEDLFKVDSKNSTVNDGPFNKIQISKLLSSDLLIPRYIGNAYSNYKQLRTKGCQCGAWRSLNPHNHSPMCPLYTRGGI